jgi:hypothetical protein
MSEQQIMDFTKAEPYSCPLFEIDPAKIWVEQVDSGKLAFYQKQMSKAVWRPAPGRKLGFLVKHGETLIGLIFLASPVINLTERDKRLNMPKDPKQKGKALRSVMDISVCVSAQPIGWHYNLGKLCAMIAPTLGDFFTTRYNEDLQHLVTTSLWGRGTQYNRVFEFLGYTKGHGHEHITDDKYHAMMQWLRDNGHEVPSCKFGAGSNPRMRRISAYRKASGDKTVTLVHGNKRGIYYHPALSPDQRKDVILKWHSRWGKPRYLKTKDLAPPYSNGLEPKPFAEQVSIKTRIESIDESEVKVLGSAPISPVA